MSAACHADAAGGAGRADEGAAADMAKWLSLAATPTFAIMALMTAVVGGGPMDMLCSAGQGSQLTGMVAMYMLMGAFHSGPWLKLIGSRRRRAHRNSAAPAVRRLGPNSRHAFKQSEEPRS